jgi:hypothetical protein
MNLIRTIVANIGLALLCWVSILFIFATGNVLVLVFVGLAGLDFGWAFLLALVFNTMAGMLVVGIWSGESKGKWSSIALLAGLIIAIMCLSALVFTTVEHFLFSLLYSHFKLHQVKIFLSIPSLTVFSCCLYLWKKEYRGQLQDKWN